MPTKERRLKKAKEHEQRRLDESFGIKYQRLGDGHFYAQELFEQEELTG